MRRPLGTLIGLLTAGVLLAPAAGATASAAPVTPDPDPGLVGPVQRPDRGDRPGDRSGAARAADGLTLTGRGHGHGRGLSQYGAKGAAEDGWSYRRIVSFYYPGTTWDRAAGRMQVLITGDTTRDLVVRDRPGLRLRPVGGSWSPLHDARPSAVAWRVVPAAKGRSQVDYRTAQGSWTRLRTVDGEVEVGAGRAPVQLETPAGTTAYRGVLRSVDPPPGSSDDAEDRDTVNVVPMESYLRGVVPREVPALWPAAAVRAQAVAARSYAAYERVHPRNSHYQVLDTSGSQVYGGVAAEHPASDEAVRATRRQVRHAGGQPAFTQFSASNGGWTAKGSFAYLPAQQDRNEEGSGNPYATWRRTVSSSALESAYPAIGRFTGVELRGRTGDGQWGGRVGTVVVTGGQGRVTVPGETFRSVFGLPSTWFTRA